jgi:transcriptional regulator
MVQHFLSVAVAIPRSCTKGGAKAVCQIPNLHNNQGIHSSVSLHNLLLTFDRELRLHYCRHPRGETALGNQIELLQGTLDLLILKTLVLEPMHGWGIAQRIQQISRDVLQVGQGSLYPALHRLEQRGWIGAEWSTSDNNRRAKFYSLTRAGRNQLEKELGEWERLSAAIALVLQQS